MFQKCFLLLLFSIPCSSHIFATTGAVESAVSHFTDEFLTLTESHKDLSSEDFNRELSDLYRTYLKVPDHPNSATLPSSRQLAKTLVELVIWAQIMDQVETQVWAQVKDQIEPQIWAKIRNQHWAQCFAGNWTTVVKTQAENQAWARLRDQVWGQIIVQVREQVRDQAGYQFWTQLGHHIHGKIANLPWTRTKHQSWNQTGIQIRSKIRNMIESQTRTSTKKGLSRFNFSDPFNRGVLNEALKPAIEYGLMVSQLASAEMRESDVFQKIIADLTANIHSITSDRQIEIFFSQIAVPESESLLINNQLESIRLNQFPYKSPGGRNTSPTCHDNYETISP